MNLSRFVTLALKPVLFFLEYVLKFSAGVVAAIVLGAGGSFFNKLVTGYGSLISVFQQIAEWPEQVAYLSTVIRDYNTLTASAFNQQYGGQAMNRVMESLNEGVAYGQAVYQNFIHQPVATILATLIAFLTFYVIARTCRFFRQKGRGSFLVKKERELGEKVFNRSEG